MGPELRKPSLTRLAKAGKFDELRRVADTVEDFDLAYIFDRAVTDFREVRRNPGHGKILQWCLSQGLDLRARGGWLNESVVCLAAGFGNNEIVASMIRRGLPDCPFARTAVGDIDFLSQYAGQHDLAELRDENGFNLLYQ